MPKRLIPSELPNEPRTQTILLDGAHTEPRIVYQDNLVTIAEHMFQDELGNWYGGCIFAAWKQDGEGVREDLYRTFERLGRVEAFRWEENHVRISFEVLDMVWLDEEEEWDYRTKWSGTIDFLLTRCPSPE